MAAQRCEYTVKTTHYTPLLFCFVMEFPRLAWNGIILRFCWLLKSRECTYGPNGLCRLSRGLSNYDCNISKCVLPVKGHGAIKAQCRPATNRQYNRAPLYGLPAERLRQGIPGNLQPLRQHQGSEKNGPKVKNLSNSSDFFSVKTLAKPHKIRYIQKAGLIGALYELKYANDNRNQQR